MSWQQKVPGTFGCEDLIFAAHTLDSERAFDLLEECYKANVPLQDVLDEAENYLKSQGALVPHILSEIDKIRKKYDDWLE